MKLDPSNQKKLIGLDNYITELISLFRANKLPNRIMITGPKGSGKCTLAYHLINYVLSFSEDNAYDIKNFEINSNNRTYKLINNSTNPNFYLIDVMEDKKYIDISQIRSLIENLNKSSFNNKPRFVLLDNIELLNINSINALLKIVEEPNENIYFIFINSNKNILSTLKSRCLEFKISLSNNKTKLIIDKLLPEKHDKLINKDLLNYYYTPGKIVNLYEFSIDYEIDLKNIQLKDFLEILIKKKYYNKNALIRTMLFELIEFYITTKISLINFNFYNFFIKKIDNTKKFNLDEEVIFLEFESKILNG